MGYRGNKAFNLVKQQLAEAPVLEHYDPTKPLMLATDVSPYGIGAVLSHHGRWIRETSCLRLSYAEWYQEEVLTTWQGGPGHHFWHQTFSSVLIRKTVFHRFRPQAIAVVAKRVPCHTDHGICETAALGIAPRCLSVYNLILARRKTSKCWWFEQIATPGHTLRSNDSSRSDFSFADSTVVSKVS